MKHAYSIGCCLLLGLVLLVSGCMVFDGSTDRREQWARSQEEFLQKQIKPNSRWSAAEQMVKNAKFYKLLTRFEVVFEEPDYLSLSRTPAREALAGYFCYIDERGPTADQFNRLVEIVQTNPRLVMPLRSIWLSHHATLAQRVAFARMIEAHDAGLRNYSMNRLGEPWVFRCVFQSERLSIADYRKLLTQFNPKGRVYAWLSSEIAEREEERRETERAANWYESHKRR